MIVRFAFLPKHFPLTEQELTEIRAFLEKEKHLWLNMVEYGTDFKYYPDSGIPRPNIKKEARIYFDFFELNPQKETWKQFADRLGHFLSDTGHSVPWVTKKLPIKDPKIAFGFYHDGISEN